MRKKKQIKILAIDPGAREMGLAILENDELAYFGVKTLKTKRPAEMLYKAVRRIIYKLIDDYGPDVLVVEVIKITITIPRDCRCPSR